MNEQQQNGQVNAGALQTTGKEKGRVTYNVAGQDVTLSYQIVRDFLTKGNGQVSDQDLVQFISVCKFNQLNPFLNEAYLIKFGTQPAQMIVSKEALMKRADACPSYDGIQSGIIVQNKDGVCMDVEGCFHTDAQKLVGGWAKVFRSDRKYPIVARVNLSEYDKKQSIWNEKKSTMISKIAKVQALREAFPAQLGAMYTQDESRLADYQDVTKQFDNEKKENANRTEIKVDLGKGDDKASSVVVDTETGKIKYPGQSEEPEKAAAPGF